MPPSPGTDLGFEDQLWKAADALRSNMDAAEYKHVVLGLIFLKYISDAFEEKHAELEAERKSGADPEDPDEYRAVNIFWVPTLGRWKLIKESARLGVGAKIKIKNGKEHEYEFRGIGPLIDDAMIAIERDNPGLGFGLAR